MTELLTPTGRFRGAEVVDASRNHLEPEEVKRLFDVLKGPSLWATYFRLQYYFGCRISEPAILFREDVSIATKEIIVKRLKKRQFEVKTVVGEDGKKSRVKDTSKQGTGLNEHVYTLPDELVARLREHMELMQADRRTKGNPWLFPSPRKPRHAPGADRLTLIRRSGGYSAVSRHAAEEAFVHSATAADLPKHLRHSHVLRHTRATLMLAAGAAEEDVKELLGHSSISTTRRYLGVARSLRLRLHTVAQLGDGVAW